MFEDTYFRRKKMNIAKLLAFGFEESGDGYRYATEIMDGGFVLEILIDAGGKVSTEMFERDTGEEYILYKVAGAVGGFVGDVKSECERVLTDISEKCYEPDIFKGKQTKELIECVRERYGDELEFLWEKFPDNAIWRRKDSKKWYGIIMTVSRKKLGLPEDEVAEVVDLRAQPECMADIVDNERYFPGWHMSKKSWFTIILDGSVPTAEICEKIDESYGLAVK